MICRLITPHPIVVKDGIGAVHLDSGISYEVHFPFEDGSHCFGDTPAHYSIYHHINERGQSLYGFKEDAHRDLFKSLITVDGIGPTAAMKLMGSYEADKIRIDIADGDVDDLSKAKGIGKKSAQKIIDKLKDKYLEYKTKGEKVGSITPYDSDKWAHNECFRTVKELAVRCLLKLGFKKAEVVIAVTHVMSMPYSQEGSDGDELLQSVIKESLKQLKG